MNLPFNSLYDKYKYDLASEPYYEKSRNPRHDYDLYNKRDNAPVPLTESRTPEPKPNPMEKPAPPAQPPRKSGLGARGQMNY